MQVAADIMTSPVVRIAADATVAAALERMREAAVSCLLVEPTDADEPPGFFSQTDAIEHIVAPQRDPSAITVSEVMSRPVITVPPQTSVQDCALLMRKSHIRRVLVHDGEAITGIVSASDVLGLSGARPARGATHQRSC